MVLLTKDEKNAVAERFPNAHIVRTMKQKSKRHRYYCEESASVMRFLNNLRGKENTNKTKGGVNSDYRKKTKRVGA